MPAKNLGGRLDGLNRHPLYLARHPGNGALSQAARPRSRPDDGKGTVFGGAPAAITIPVHTTPPHWAAVGRLSAALDGSVAYSLPSPGRPQSGPPSMTERRIPISLRRF